MCESETSEIVGGNTISPTKKISQGKSWCFTKNNYEKKDIKGLIEIFEMKNMEYIFSEEMGSGTPHLQGWVLGIKRFRPSELKFSEFKWDQLHWEKAKGNLQQNIEYIKKEKGKLYTNLKLPKRKWLEIDLYDWQIDLLKILRGDPDDRKIYWIWEAAGNTGKTTFQKYVFSKMKDVVVLGGKADDMKNGIVEYQKRSKGLPSIVLVNIPRVNRGAVSIAGIEAIKDMFFYSGKYEGGMVCGDPPHVLVFSNQAPNLSKMSMDRWDVRNISDEQGETLDELDM